MINKDLQRYKNQITESIKTLRLYDAFSVLRNMAASYGPWCLNQEIDRVEQSYRMMLKYTIEGIEDPERENVYKNIVSSLLRLYDMSEREAMKISKSSKCYFVTLRLLESQHVGTLSRLFEEYEDEFSFADVLQRFSKNSDTSDCRDVKVNREKLEMNIFNRLWTSYPLSVEEETAVANAMNSEVFPPHFKQLMISAILLGLMEYYDEARLRLLLTFYQSTDEQIAVKSLCAALIGLYLYKDRELGPKMLAQISLTKDLPQWNKDLKMAFFQLIKTRDTERINQKMQDELLPEMMKLRPDLYKNKPNFTADIDIQALDENPEWQELLESSGIADKMKELSELQQEGSDVFMSTFSHLKSYSFFSFISNWFLPFYAERTEVTDALGENDSLAAIIASSPFLCDSDKYSLALSMKSIPESHRSMMVSQLNAQNINLAELQNSELLPADKMRENIANKYIQDLYRFFKLNRHRVDFNNPFEGVLNLADINVLEDDLSDSELLSLISEFYFKRKFYSEALIAFNKLESIQPPSAQLYQKMGFAMQQLGDINAALRYFEQAELFDGENIWTLKHIAVCYKQKQNYAQAIEYFKRVELLLPEDISVAINIGNCLVAVASYDEAIKYFHKVEYLSEDPSTAWRKLAWCLLMIKDYKQSEMYYQKVIGASPQAMDYMNLGHLYFVNLDYKQAVLMYCKCYESLGDKQRFIDTFNNDLQYLKGLNVNMELVPFMLDAVFYNDNN